MQLPAHLHDFVKIVLPLQDLPGGRTQRDEVVVKALIEGLERLHARQETCIREGLLLDRHESRFLNLHFRTSEKLEQQNGSRRTHFEGIDSPSLIDQP